MTKERFSALLRLYYEDRLSGEDLQAFLAAAEDPAFEPEFQAFIDQGLASGYFKGGASPSQGRKVLSRIKLEGARGKQTALVVWLQRPRYWMGAAALVLALGIMGLYLFSSSKPQPQLASVAAPADSLHIPPGSSKATLTLTDGKTIQLGSAPLSLQQGSNRLFSPDAGVLYYQHDGQSAATEVGYNSVSTPRGGTYRLRLSDGTLVWLNADSKITYPTSFTAASRNVTVSGEAYFEVSPSAHQPFIVSAGSSQITVLGTAFNLRAYPDHPGSTITLLQGRVQVTAAGTSRQIAPGQQVDIDGSGTWRQQRADTSMVVGWKNGSFVFHSTDLATIMYNLEKWYDIHAVLKESIGSRHFTGSFPRSYDAAVMLRVMQANDIDIVLNGKTLTLSPKKE